MEIQINGEKRRTQASTLQRLKAEQCFSERALVTIYNGFQTEDDLPLREGDAVFFIPKGKMPEAEVLEAMLCARHTPKVHQAVKKARVGIAGLGGLGSHIAIMLARTGVGHLHLVDFDTVEPSNLNRQMYKIAHLGMAKTEALMQEIKEINPYCEVRLDTCLVTAENATELFKEEAIVCEAFDKPEAKAMLVNTLLENRKDVRVIAASGMAGYGSSNAIATKKLGSRLYLSGDFETGAGPGMGLMAPRVSICAGHQANMVLRLILEIETV